MKTLVAIFFSVACLVSALAVDPHEQRIEAARVAGCEGITYARLKNHFGTPKWNACDSMYAWNLSELRRLKPELTVFSWEKGSAQNPLLRRYGIRKAGFSGDVNSREWTALNRQGYPVRPLPKYLSPEP